MAAEWMDGLIFFFALLGLIFFCSLPGILAGYGLGKILAAKGIARENFLDCIVYELMAQLIFQVVIWEKSFFWNDNGLNWFNVVLCMGFGIIIQMKTYNYDWSTTYQRGRWWWLKEEFKHEKPFEIKETMVVFLALLSVIVILKMWRYL